MPEDRFGDLGRPDGRSAAERFEEEDRLRPEPDMPQRPPEVPRPGNQYAWVAGIVVLMGIGVLLFTTTLPEHGAGLRGPGTGKVVPDFAAPLATGDLEGDANVRGKGNDQAAGPVPACQVRSEEVFNVCELRRRPLVLTFVVDSRRRLRAAGGPRRADPARVSRRELRGGRRAATSARRWSRSCAGAGGGCPWPWTRTTRW